MERKLDIEHLNAGDSLARDTPAPNNVGPRSPGQRGRQKRPTKILITMRFSPEVLAYFKADGDGWQTRINAVLREYVSQRQIKKD